MFVRLWIFLLFNTNNHTFLDCLGNSGRFTYISPTFDKSHSNRSSVRSAISEKLRKASISKLSEAGASVVSKESQLNELEEWQDFLIHICPIDYINWGDASWFSKGFQILKVKLKHQVYEVYESTNHFSQLGSFVLRTPGHNVSSRQRKS